MTLKNEIHKNRAKNETTEKEILNLAMEKLVLLMQGQLKITKEETFAVQRNKDGVIELDFDGNPIMIKIGEKIKTEDILPDEKTIHLIVKALNKDVFSENTNAVDSSFTIIHEVHNVKNDDNNTKG